MGRGKHVEYTRKESKLKILPEITEPERSFVQEMIAGAASYSEAWTRSFDPEEKLELTTQQRLKRARALLRTKRIKAWMDYLSEATPEQLIENAYVQQIAFGAPKEQLTAANAFLESQFAGKEVAHIFIHTLQQIRAQIVVPCKGTAESLTLEP